jgi:hypothetical protein
MKAVSVEQQLKSIQIWLRFLRKPNNHAGMMAESERVKQTLIASDIETTLKRVAKFGGIEEMERCARIGANSLELFPTTGE